MISPAESPERISVFPLLEIPRVTSTFSVATDSVVDTPEVLPLFERMRPLPLKLRVLPDQRVFPEKVLPDPKSPPLPRSSPEKLRPSPDISRLPEKLPRVSPENDRVPPENPIGRFALMIRPYTEGSVALFT